ncbi:MAG: glycosyltransferase family 4 protein [Gemmatimonadaceae bacterium]
MTPPPTLLCAVSFPANTGFAWDFIERLYARMADRLAGYGVRTVVGYPSIPQPPRTLEGSAGVPMVLDMRMRSARSVAQLAAFIRRENVQAIYFTDQPAWSPWYPLLRAAGVRKIVVHDHTSGERTGPTGARRIAKKVLVNTPGLAADVVIAVSDFVADRLRDVALVSPDKITRVWNGIDPIAAGAEPTTPDVRTVLGIGADVNLVGCACRATPEKGVDVLFDAFDCMRRSLPAEAALVYIGSGPQISVLNDLRDSLSSTDCIYMAGYMPGAADLLRSANVCVVPSVWQDAFPLAVLEMMARGRAVIATRVGGVPEMIEDGVSGILVPPNDARTLSKRIGEVLASPALAKRLGDEARARVGKLFSADRQISEMLDTFLDVFVP